jgi:CO dehydrogenase/acetyl-CoA synthase beta subunit
MGRRSIQEEEEEEEEERVRYYKTLSNILRELIIQSTLSEPHMTATGTSIGFNIVLKKAADSG